MATPASVPAGTPSAGVGAMHPLFAVWRPTWVKLHDVFEGAGGFLDEARPYLIPHPREWLDHSRPVYGEDGTSITHYTLNPSPSQPSPKLIERRKLARYENVAATLIDQIAGALFRVKPERVFSDEAPLPAAGQLRPIEQFWRDSDGHGTAWDDALAALWKPGAAFGHLWGYVDVHEDDPRRIVVRWYTPLDTPDWLTDAQGRLTAVRFLEAAPRESFAKRITGSDERIREVTAEGWTLKKRNGHIVDEGAHDFGVLPVFVLYAKRRTLVPFVGRSVLGDPALYIDLYNLISETRELLRKQTFSILNVPIGERSGGLQAEQTLMGQQAGTNNVLFTTQQASYISADSANVDAYHAHMDRLIRTIYRLAVVAWESDSRDAESAESRTIKREDLNQVLAGYADELRRVDSFVTELAYRAYYGDAWERWRDRDGLSLRWPDTFEAPSLSTVVDEIGSAIGLDLGETATKTLRKRGARAVLPDASPDTLKVIDDEIDAMTVVSQEEIRQQNLAAKSAQFAEAFGG